jgi:hypothetical protein
LCDSIVGLTSVHARSQRQSDRQWRLRTVLGAGADARDCGLYQDVAVPSAGTYTLTTYTDASRAGALVGWNVNGVSLESASIVGGGYVRHTFTHQFAGGETIRVWLYSPATAGWAVIDEVSIVRTP